jgi:hypothetical protein
MKTSKFITPIATLSLVLFMSIASLANSSALNSGDLTKSDNKSLAISNTSEKDYSWLRFDVTNYLNENEVIEMPVNNLDYLRFDVNNFIESNPDNLLDLPLNEFDYLRFDVNNFAVPETALINELPVNE